MMGKLVPASVETFGVVQRPSAVGHVQMDFTRREQVTVVMAHVVGRGTKYYVSVTEKGNPRVHPLRPQLLVLELS